MVISVNAVTISGFPEIKNIPVYARSAKVPTGTSHGIKERGEGMKKLGIISLFAGCGGMDLGFLMAKHPKMSYKIVWANDFDADACRTYEKNIKHRIDRRDIWSIDLDEIPKGDVIIGGFPCQDFSILQATDRKGTATKRGLLYTKFVETVAKKLPLFFVAENVKGLLTANNGYAIKRIKKDFEKVDHAGYDVECKPINFADFGVPQNRERIIIVGVRNDSGIRFIFPEPTHKGKHVPVKTALAGVEKIKLNNEPMRIMQSTLTNLKKIPAGGNYKDIPKYADKNWMSLIYRRLHPDRPSPTIVACGGGGTWGYHYKEPRPLTNRERARIQTFPDWFEFFGSPAEVRRQIGNAVPPLGIKAIAEQLLKAVSKEIGLQRFLKTENSKRIYGKQ
jgi:DNA (cytosine-5)-methyltransferase 1